MATINDGGDSVPHELRTATEPRENRIEPVTISSIREVNSTIRLIQLKAAEPDHTIKFLPGQWLDVFIPSLPKAGGFTITSTPAQARPSSSGPATLELAIQKSKNPPAAYLHKPTASLLNTSLTIRVGGSFTYPPFNPTNSPSLRPEAIDRLLLVAGGVGINPLISIFASLIHGPASQRPKEIHFLYGTKAASPSLDPQEILFLTRLMDLVSMSASPLDVTLSLFLTGSGYDEGERIEDGRLPNSTLARRMRDKDLAGALDGWRGGAGRAGREYTVAYVCGTPSMTDQFVEFLGRQEGLGKERVLCEKWW